MMDDINLACLLEILLFGIELITSTQQQSAGIAGRAAPPSPGHRCRVGHEHSPVTEHIRWIGPAEADAIRVRIEGWHLSSPLNKSRFVLGFTFSNTGVLDIDIY